VIFFPQQVTAFWHNKELGVSIKMNWLNTLDYFLPVSCYKLDYFLKMLKKYLMIANVFSRMKKKLNHVRIVLI
jgi:hypothetical protein